MDRSTTHDQEFREDQHEGEMDREILEKRETRNTPTGKRRRSSVVLCIKRGVTDISRLYFSTIVTGRSVDHCPARDSRLLAGQRRKRRRREKTYHIRCLRNTSIRQQPSTTNQDYTVNNTAIYLTSSSLV